MEPKKNPKYDVHSKRNLIFNFSLALSLLIVISAFRIAVPYSEKKVLPPYDDGSDEIIPPIPVTDHRKPEPKKPDEPIRKPVNMQNLKPAEDPGIESDNPEVDQNNIDNPFDFQGVSIPIETVDDTITWIYVEHKPEPVGGYNAFYKTLRDNTVYPVKAKRHHVSGKVFVEFTIDQSGEVTNARILRGIGYGCDEEALRVIRLTRWHAGKQRGKPVKVRMVLPINFEIR